MSSSHPPVHVFAYGTLMFDPVWTRVVQGKYRCAHASLEGHRRLRIRGETYPALRPGEAHQRVNGVLYFAIDPDDLQRLDRFEGAEYERQRLVVETPKGPMEAGVYVYKEQFVRRLSGQEWEPEWFASKGIHRFLSRYRGFI